MADLMSAPIPHWEKSGNVTWVACPSCHGWFPVADELVELNTIQMVCPHCAARFGASQAADTRRP
jgi:hypothetical protein